MNDNYKILLVEDDPNLGILIKEFLEVKDYEVVLATNGEEGWIKYKELNFDLLIFDIMMPKKDGFSLAQDIRKNDEETPLIFLTAKSLQADKIDGFKIGADDYITKPFSMEELLLRISRILKRTTKKKKLDAIVQIGNYKFDTIKRNLVFDKSIIKLTSKENQLLSLLISNKGEILKRNEALKKVWKSDNYFNARSMDVYVSKLRQHLKEDKSIEIINIHGEGFKIIY
jgi:DNA-binding response OmpR family regulator